MLWKYSGKIDPIQPGNELLQLLSLPLGEPVPHWTFEPETHPDVWLIGHSHCLSKADYWLIMIDSFLKFITPVIRPAKQAFIIILILLLLITTICTVGIRSSLTCKTHRWGGTDDCIQILACLPSVADKRLQTLYLQNWCRNMYATSKQTGHSRLDSFFLINSSRTLASCTAWEDPPLCSGSAR